MPKRTQRHGTAVGQRQAKACKNIWLKTAQLGVDSAGSLEGAPPREHELGRTYSLEPVSPWE